MPLSFISNITVGLALIAALFTGCDRAMEGAKKVFNAEAGRSTETASRPRVNAVTASASVIPQGWCSLKFEPSVGPKLTLPKTQLLNQGKTTGEHPRWVNMWATWCKPCIAELLHILSWHKAKLGTGTDINLELLSIDEDEKVLQAFMTRRPELAAIKQQRMVNPSELEEFAKSLGLDEDTTVPIHIFTDRQDHIVCVRTGGIADTDLGVVRELLK